MFYLLLSFLGMTNLNKPLLILKFLTILIIIFLMKNILSKSDYSSQSNNESKYFQMQDLKQNSRKAQNVEKSLILTSVVCGNKFYESINMIKSSLLFNKIPLKITIFADNPVVKLFGQFKHKLNYFLTINGSRFNNTIDVRLIKFPIEIEHSRNYSAYCKTLKTIFPVCILKITYNIIF